MQIRNATVKKSSSVPSTSDDFKKKATSGIVVVHSGDTAKQAEKARFQDETLLELINLPKFQPIINDNLQNVNLKNEFNSGSFNRICLQLQEMLMKSSQIVAYDQSLLTNQIKEIDFVVEQIHCKFENQKRQLNVFETKLQQSVSDLNSSLMKCHNSLNDSYQLIDSINALFDKTN